MREKIAIVNDDDEEIAVKYRDELLSDEMHRIVSVWITNDAGDILLAQRALHKELHPGLWGPAAAGAVSYGETYEEAAYKELAEEIGVTDCPLKFVKKVMFKIEDEKRFVCWYAGISNKAAEDFALENDVAQVRWFSKENLQKELKTNPVKFVPSKVLWQELFLS